MATPKKDFFSVLLADDDSDDRMLFEEAVSELALDLDLQMVKDGEELMQYLSSALILPEFLFLDLNMPFKNGFKCLEEIRANNILQEIFVIIYSTTSNKSHIDEAFEKGANLFIKKPNSFSDLKIILSKLFSLDIKKCFSAVPKDKFVFEV